MRVNAIAPGVIQTQMIEGALEREPEFYAAFKQKHAMNRFGTADELVGPALFLASDAGLVRDRPHPGRRRWLRRPVSSRTGTCSPPRGTHATRRHRASWRGPAIRQSRFASSRCPASARTPRSRTSIYQELRERIAFGDFEPGDRLVEADLATRFGVSKTPVREALLTLEADGLVVLRPHRGAEVSRLTAEEWSELIFLRDALEIGALDEIMAAMTEEDFAQAEAALISMADAWAEHDYRRYRRVQRQLHAIILGAPGSAIAQGDGAPAERSAGPVRAAAGDA